MDNNWIKYSINVAKTTVYYLCVNMMIKCINSPSRISSTVVFSVWEQ
jgi:hypothetical protein